MAIVTRLEWPDNTAADYDAVMAAAGYADEGEPGGIYHVSCVDENGIHIVDTWESAEEMQQFVETRLGPILGQLQFPPPARQEVYPVHNLIIPPGGQRNAASGAVRLVFDIPGCTADQYDQVIRDLDAAGLGHPAGRLYHVAASTPQGWYVMDVWESPAAVEAFAPQLMPVLAKAGIPTDQPPSLQPIRRTLTAPNSRGGRGRTLMAVAVPIVAGQEARWREFVTQLQGARHADFAASRVRLGVRERTFVQHTPNGDVVIVTLEGENPGAAFAGFGQSDDEFTHWFVDEVKAVHGLDLRVPPEEAPSEQIADSGDPEERNRATVRTFLQGLSERNVNVIDEVAGPGYRNYIAVPGAPFDLAGARDALQQFFDAFPDMEHHERAMVTEGDTVAVHYTITATHQGVLNGVPPTGKAVALDGISLYRLRDGKIVEDYPGFSALDILAQLGALPVPVAAG